MAISLSELIAAIGNDNVYVQPLANAIVGEIKLVGTGRKQFTRLTIGTREITLNDFLGEPKRIGLLVFFDKDKFDAAVESIKAKQAAASE